MLQKSVRSHALPLTATNLLSVYYFFIAVMVI